MRFEKTQMVNDIGKLLNDSAFVFFVTYKGLSVKKFSDFRNKLAECEASCHVLKNTLIKKAAELHGPAELADFELLNDTAMVTGNGDAGMVAKVIDNFFKANEEVAPKGGYMEGAALSETDVKDIAALPPREVLYAQIIGVIQAPARNFVSVLNNKASSIVNVLNNYKNKLEENN
jgi:large subunit ribosomal protein L10